MVTAPSRPGRPSTGAAITSGRSPIPTSSLSLSLQAFLGLGLVSAVLFYCLRAACAALGFGLFAVGKRSKTILDPLVNQCLASVAARKKRYGHAVVTISRDVELHAVLLIEVKYHRLIGQVGDALCRWVYGRFKNGLDGVVLEFLHI